MTAQFSWGEAPPRYPAGPARSGRVVRRGFPQGHSAEVADLVARDERFCGHLRRWLDLFVALGIRAACCTRGRELTKSNPGPSRDPGQGLPCCASTFRGSEFPLPGNVSTVGRSTTFSIVGGSPGTWASAGTGKPEQGSRASRVIPAGGFAPAGYHLADHEGQTDALDALRAGTVVGTGWPLWAPSAMAAC